MDKKQIARIRTDLYALPGGPFTLEPVGIARNELRQLLNALEAARDAYQARMDEAIKVLKG